MPPNLRFFQDHLVDYDVASNWGNWVAAANLTTKSALEKWAPVTYCPLLVITSLFRALLTQAPLRSTGILRRCINSREAQQSFLLRDVGEYRGRKVDQKLFQ